MKVQVTDYINIEEKSAMLKYTAPTGITILPRNFEEAETPGELVHQETVHTVRSLLRQAGIVETQLEDNSRKIPQGAKKSWDWVSPTMFISSSVVIPVIVNIISSYLIDYFKGHPKDTETTIEFVKEKTENKKGGGKKEYVRITFKGQPQEFEKIDQAAIEKILNDLK